MLPEALAECHGPYRPGTANSEAGVFTWSHVSDEHCTMLHDKLGNSIVTMESAAIRTQVSSAASVARGHPTRKDWWADMLRGTETSMSLGEEASVTCTSAGQTTRLIFDLMESQQAAVIPPPHVSNAWR